MFIATVVVSVLLAGLAAESARGKFTRNAIALQITKTTGFPEDRLWILGMLELAGALGLVAGLFWWPLGVAAATGLTLYFIGGALAHVRANDPGWTPALVMSAISATALTLRVLSS